MVQSCIINTLALWVMFADEERKDMNATERVYGYTGACGMIQGLAAGYFLWDVVVSTRHFKIFGWGVWAHAVSAFFVYSFGFRPYCNYYGPIFILYELSTPFLNIHWFCDKLGMTGGKLQWVNGILLLTTFFGSRLVWGIVYSLRVFQDTWAAMHLNTSTPGYLDMANVMHNLTTSTAPIFAIRDGQMCLGEASCVAAQAEVMKFAGPGTEAVPWWLAIIYLSCNVLLNSLNVYWFGRMVETVRKRFDGTPHDEYKHEREGARRRSSISVVQDIVHDAADSLEKDTVSGADVVAARTTGSKLSVNDSGTEINKRRKDVS